MRNGEGGKGRGGSEGGGEGGGEGVRKGGRWKGRGGEGGRERSGRGGGGGRARENGRMLKQAKETLPDWMVEVSSSNSAALVLLVLGDRHQITATSYWHSMDIFMVSDPTSPTQRLIVCVCSHRILPLVANNYMYEACAEVITCALLL